MLARDETEQSSEDCCSLDINAGNDRTFSVPNRGLIPPNILQGIGLSQSLDSMSWFFGCALAVSLSLLVVCVIVLAKPQNEAKMRKMEFLQRVGSLYGYAQEKCGHIDRWRVKEFPGLAAPLGRWFSGGKIHYIDYAGAALPSKSQILAASRNNDQIFGNPHSSHDDGRDDSETSRRLVRECFGLSEECGVLWVSGATDGLRLVASHFSYKKLAYHVDSHTSVVGCRRIALQRGAEVVCVEKWEELKPCSQGLAIVTVESNFNGARTRASLPDGWTACLDSAKAAATSPFQMADADFAVVSFYKLFGAPTGLGAVLTSVRGTRALLSSKRERGYFGGGSIDRVSPKVVDWTVVKNQVEAAFSDGTPHYRGIASLPSGFAELDRVGGLGAVELHAAILADELASRLRQLPLCLVYERRVGSSIVIFNVLRPDGSILSPAAVCSFVEQNGGVRVRSGCLCNPGACGEILGLDHGDFVAAWERGAACGTADDIAEDGRPLGVVRASFGKDSIWEDLDALVTSLKNIAREFDKVEDEKVDEKIPMATVALYRLDEINVFPVKGCRPMRPSKWPVEENGRLRFDREWAIIDDRLGVVVTAKTHAAVALIDASIVSGIAIAERPIVPDYAQLRLSFEDNVIIVPIGAFSQNGCVVRVCGSERACHSLAEMDAAVSSFFSIALTDSDDSKRFRLVRTEQASLANTAPLLLVTTSAVSRLNVELASRGEKKVTADHFRPNLVVSTTTNLPNHPEDTWTSLTLPNLSLDVVGPCDRCSAVDVDPITAKASNTLRILSSYRLKHKRAKVTFGIFLRRTPLEEDDEEDRNRDGAKKKRLLLRRGDTLLPTAV